MGGFISVIAAVAGILASIISFQRSCEPRTVSHCVVDWYEWVTTSTPDDKAIVEKEKRRQASEEARLKELEAKKAADKAAADRIATQQRAKADEQLREEERRKAEVVKAEQRAALDAELETQRRRDLQRRREQEESQAAERRKAAEEAVRPRHRLWSYNGSTYEYRQNGSSIALFFVNPSPTLFERGARSGNQSFYGTYSGAGNQMQGTTTSYLRPGCTAQFPTKLTIHPDMLIMESSEQPGACGFIVLYAGNFVFTPAR